MAWAITAFCFPEDAFASAVGIKPLETSNRAVNPARQDKLIRMVEVSLALVGGLML